MPTPNYTEIANAALGDTRFLQELLKKKNSRKDIIDSVNKKFQGRGGSYYDPIRDLNNTHIKKVQKYLQDFTDVVVESGNVLTMFSSLFSMGTKTPRGLGAPSPWREPPPPPPPPSFKLKKRSPRRG